MPALKAKAATLVALALALTLLTGCSDDHQTDSNPCGDTGKPVTGFDTGTVGTFDGARQAFVTRAGGGSGGSGGGKGGGSTSSGSKGSSSSTGSGGIKSWFGGGPSKASSASTAFTGSKVTGSRTFTTPDGTKYATAPRTTIPLRPMTFMSPPPTVMMPGMHYPWMWWAIYGNYRGATTVIECR